MEQQFSVRHLQSTSEFERTEFVNRRRKIGYFTGKYENGRWKTSWHDECAEYKNNENVREIAQLMRWFVRILFTNCRKMKRLFGKEKYKVDNELYVCYYVGMNCVYMVRYFGSNCFFLNVYC